MSKQARLNVKIYAANLIVIFVSLYGVRLGSLWVAIQLVMITVPMLLLNYQEKDAKDRPIPRGERQRGIIGDLGFRYSQAGGKFAVFFSEIIWILLMLLKIEGWWPHLGVTTIPQELVITASLVVSMGCLFAYVCRRWPDEPTEQKA